LLSQTRPHWRPCSSGANFVTFDVPHRRRRVRQRCGCVSRASW
jgi:hypothetical protein